MTAFDLASFVAPLASTLASGIILWQVRRLYSRLRHLEDMADTNQDRVDEIYEKLD